MAYIKFKAEIPEWFHLEEYVEKRLEAKDILPNLIYRKILYGFIKNKLTVEVVNKEDCLHNNCIFELNGNLKLCSNRFAGNNEYQRKKIISFMFENIKKNPITPFSKKASSDNFLFEPINMCFSIFMNGFTQHTVSKPINELSSVDFARKYFSLSKVHRNFIKSEILAFGDTRNSENEEELLFSHENRNGLTREIVDDCRGSFFSMNVKNMKNNNLVNNPFIEVNLNFTNTFLIRQFEQWLNKKRIQLSNNNISYDEDLLDADPNTLINKINEYRIFAYLDLCFWEVIEQHKIKKSVFAITLFPNGEKGESIFKNLDENFLPPLMISAQSKEMRRLISLYNLEKIDF
ncbi:hypothetical protein QE380_001244 [Acinetobacter baylyi]|uniref:Uncharacterized protein n=1 Tax=Acinetobacter baylyi TaxID=202950 RepID=A0ABU0UUU3_ACIBI|nr:DUF6387 family protein [Acinetobacter baylyi]MDQ1208321.1 hypothetical protein [Acinetobacter baylyi]MDR6108089.1 hypothetical protein [Acinetobacter baylyi]MDR6185193.1 hypothetical protein [Acinetobacter baylyi]